jgi:hypothetical protein
LLAELAAAALKLLSCSCLILELAFATLLESKGRYSVAALAGYVVYLVVDAVSDCLAYGEWKVPALDASEGAAAAAAALKYAAYCLQEGPSAAGEIFPHLVVAEVEGVDLRFVDFALGYFRVVVAVGQIHRQNSACRYRRYFVLFAAVEVVVVAGAVALVASTPGLEHGAGLR